MLNKVVCWNFDDDWPSNQPLASTRSFETNWISSKKAIVFSSKFSQDNHRSKRYLTCHVTVTCGSVQQLWKAVVNCSLPSSGNESPSSENNNMKWKRFSYSQSLHNIKGKLCSDIEGKKRKEAGWTFFCVVIPLQNFSFYWDIQCKLHKPFGRLVWILYYLWNHLSHSWQRKQKKNAIDDIFTSQNLNMFG